MERVISTERFPIKMWLRDMEAGALEQAKHLASLPFIHKHVAIMPDSHQGYGMPIGGVIATKGVVIPNAVGVDIGCGMCALETDLEDIQPDILRSIMNDIRGKVPVGFKWHDKKQDEMFMPESDLVENGSTVVYRQYDRARQQLGTLGGGNHFIEIQKGCGHIWFMIHSGSRNLGKQVADHYNKIAMQENARWHSQVSKEWQLAFLPIETPQAKIYLKEMQYCVDFALANREHMMRQILGVFHQYFPDNSGYFPMTNIAHNYAAFEHHYGKDVLVHRKGATRAYTNQLGIIPGSQGTKSYIVQGKGNPESFKSCSHGAGRKMGRKQAIRELSLEKEQNILNKQGIVHSIRSAKDLDEAPGAYKDIGEVMTYQQDLVDIIVELTPLAIIKG